MTIETYPARVSAHVDTDPDGTRDWRRDVFFEFASDGVRVEQPALERDGELFMCDLVAVFFDASGVRVRHYDRRMHEHRAALTEAQHAEWLTRAEVEIARTFGFPDETRGA